MKKHLLFMLSGCLLLFGCNTNKTIEHDIVSSGMRPPAYPLITIDPYTSAWSTTDNLYDSNVCLLYTSDAADE